jgi:imidazolonepropionase-like amidohydrolase
MIRANLILVSAVLAAGVDDSFLLRNITIHPVSAPVINNGMVLVKDGKIAGVGPKLAAEKGMKVVDGKGAHLWPGIINSATELGLQEIRSIRETVDTGELGLFNPQLRPLIAVNPESEFIPVTRANGITAAITMPSSGASGGRGTRSTGGGTLIPGQVSMIHLDGWTWEEMEIKRSAALQLLFPTIETQTFSFFEMGVNRSPYTEAKKFFDTRVKELNDYFEKARAYQKAKAAGSKDLTTDLALEAMIPVLEGKLPLMIHAKDERTIKAAIEFIDKQKVKAILADVQRPGVQVAAIKQRNLPVILSEASRLPEEEDDPYDKNYSLAAELHKAGIKFCFGTFDNQFARNMPFEAGFSVGYGLPMEAAVRSVTLSAAEIWGIADQYGSIDPGKWADLVLTDGDFLEPRTQVKAVWIKGKSVNLENKHTRLYEKYKNRP